MANSEEKIPRVLTEAQPIPDITPAVEKLKTDAAVTEAEHEIVQADILKNTQAIDKLKTSDTNTQTSRDEESQRNREAIAALELKQDILDGKYSKTQPVAPQTTAEQDKTAELQRQEESRVGRARSIIAYMIVGTSCALFGYQYVTGSDTPFPTALATALGAVILYLFQKPSAVLGTVVPSPIDQNKTSMTK